jgi:hypothetical protein
MSKDFSIERTCGPAPASLSGHKWLLEYKSDVSNCSGSILTSGRIADGSCIPVDLDDGVVIDCTDTTHTEVYWQDCEVNDCGKSFCHFSITRGPKKDINVCKESKTLQCLQL